MKRALMLDVGYPEHSSRMTQVRSEVNVVKVSIGVGDPHGEWFEDLEVTVNTGRTFTEVPRELLQRKGVPVKRQVRARLADDSFIQIDVGWTVVRLEGQQFTTPVVFAEEGQPSVLGRVSMAEAILAVDPQSGQLVPTTLTR